MIEKVFNQKDLQDGQGFKGTVSYLGNKCLWRLTLEQDASGLPAPRAPPAGVASRTSQV